MCHLTRASLTGLSCNLPPPSPAPDLNIGCRADVSASGATCWLSWVSFDHGFEILRFGGCGRGQGAGVGGRGSASITDLQY